MCVVNNLLRAASFAFGDPTGHRFPLSASPTSYIAKWSTCLQAAAYNASQVNQTDLSALQAGHRFIRGPEDDVDNSLPARLAKKYYDRLFKEYCIADLSRFKESKIGLRWVWQHKGREAPG